MKKLILYKTTASAQIGHLYEHLFCTSLTEHFRREGLFSYLDYYIDAKTYHSGFIRLEIDLFSQRSLEVEASLYSLPMLFDEDTISGALLQIMAEKYADVRGFDEEEVLSTLEKYHAQPWKPLGTIALSDNTHLLKAREGFSLRSRSARHFSILEQAISFEPSYTSLNREVYLPLFAVISRVVRLNLQEEIANHSYCYSYDDNFVSNAREIKDINLYRIDKRQSTKIRDEIEIAKGLVKEMIAAEVAEKLSNFLLKAVDEAGKMPDDTEIMKATGMAVGPKGWHQIGTLENILEVLKHTSIEFKLGRSSDSLSLKRLVK